MSSELPPTDFFNGISFNKSFYQSSSDDYLTASTGKKMFLSYPIAQGEEIFPSNITLQSSLTDSTGSKGTSTQVLSSTGTGTQWTNAGGNTDYSLLNTSTFPFTLSTSVSTTYFVYIIGTAVGVTLTIPTTYPVGQQLIIKNGTAVATPITINLAPSVVSLFSQITASATTSLEYGDVLDIIWNGAIWFQQTSTSKFSSISSRGAITGLSLDLSSGNITGVGTITTSSSITSGSGGISATTGSISTAGGSISQTGTITGSSVISPSLNAVATDTNIAIATTQTNGSLSIGTGSRTTSGTISIGTGGGSVAVPINIGGSGSLTTIYGRLTTSLGTIAGRTSYLELDTGATLPALDFLQGGSIKHGLSNELTNGELSELVKHYKIKKYHGAFIDDRMPSKLLNGFYIINLNGHSHWTVLLKDGDKFFFFDSFGFVASQEVEDQIGEYIYSDVDIQHLNSSSCGFFCIAWMRWMQDHKKKK